MIKQYFCIMFSGSSITSVVASTIFHECPTENTLKEGTLIEIGGAPLLTFVLEVATASSCHWKLHGRIRGYSEENPLNQYDRAVISPYVRTSRK
jgi:hypothetical protein